MGTNTSAERRHGTASLRFWFAIAMALALTLVFALQLSHASADTTTNVVVHSSDVGTSWSTGDTRSGGAVSFVSGPTPAPLGTGSLQLSTTDANGGASQAKAQLFNYSYAGTNISDITALSYSDYHSSASLPPNSAQRASINIEVTDPVLGFTTLVYEPYEQGVTLQDDTWQSWNTLNGVWWSTGTLPGHTNRFDTVPWSTIISDYPNATITGGIGFNVGSGWNGTTSNNADALAIGVSGNTKIFDFEPGIGNNVQMTVLDSHGAGIPGAHVSDTSTWLGYTDSSGVVTANIPAGTYTFHVDYNGTSASYGPVAVTSDATLVHTFQTSAVTVTLSAHNGGPLAGGTVAFGPGTGTWLNGTSNTSTTDASGAVTGQLFNGTYRFRMQYNTGTEYEDAVNVSGNTTVPFKTGLLSIVYSNDLAFGQGNPNSTWFTKAGTELLPGTYLFNPNGSGCSPLSIDAPDAGTAATKTIFAAHLIDSTGAAIAGDSATYYAGGWQAMGTTDVNGWVCKVADGSLGNVYVAMTHNGTRQQIGPQNVTTNSIFSFQTAAVTVQLQRGASNAPLSGGTASYYANGWHTIGTTASNGQTTTEMLPGTYSFAMVYNGMHQQLNSVAISGTAANVTFETTQVAVEVRTPDGLGRIVDDPAEALSYYADGWHTKTAVNGIVSLQMLPGNYSFAAVYKGMREQLNNVTVSGDYTNVNFLTTGVTVQLQRSTGSNPPLSGGTASYYANGWHTIGTTDNTGQLTILMLPGSYSFAMEYNGTREQMNAVSISGTTDNVTFQTTLVTVLLRTPDGQSPITDVAASASYYANGWHTVATNNGYAPFLMLPGNYSFAMVYRGTREQLNNVTVSGTTTNVKFLTAEVDSGTNTATSYYANGWQPFTNDMYLLPGTYTFHFSDGTSNTAYTLTGGETTNIH